MRNKGVLSDVMTGIFGLGAITLIFIILNQVYTWNIYPYAIREGTDAGNLNWINIGWTTFLIPVGLAFLYSMMTAGQKGRMDTGGI